MIEVFATRKGEKCRLWVEGHAKRGKDRDAVCAGVSALVQSLVLYAVQGARRCRHLRYSVAPGQVFFSCCGMSEAFEVVLSGLAAIAREHGENLTVDLSIGS